MMRILQRHLGALPLAFLSFVVAIDLLVPNKLPPLVRGEVSEDGMSYVIFLCILTLVCGFCGLRHAHFRQRHELLAGRLGGQVTDSVRQEYRSARSQTDQAAAQLGALSLFVFGLLLITLLTAKLDLIASDIIPAPFLVFAHLQADQKVLLQATGWTSLRLLVSLVVGSTTAMYLGMRLGQRRILRNVLEPHISLASSLPPIVLAGVFVALLGPRMLATIFPVLREPSSAQVFFRSDLQQHWFFQLYFDETVQVVLTTWAVFWPVFSAAVAGSVQCPRTLLEAAEIAGASSKMRIRHVIQPYALPGVFTNIRVSLIIGFIVLLWIESVRPSSRNGLGKWVYQYYEENSLAAVFACIGITSVILVTFASSIEKLRRWAIPWEELAANETSTSIPSGFTSDCSSDRCREWLNRKEKRQRKAGVVIMVNNVTKSYGPIRALNLSDQCLQIDSALDGKGKVISIIGGSSHGKTTLVKVIAGLIQPDDGRGQIRMDGHLTWDGSVNSFVAGRMRVAYVFQDFALFPHMRVIDNILFPLAVRQEISSAKTTEMLELISLLGLSGHEYKFPAQLSGGQKQRVAIARALIDEPDLLILDEPLASLDQPTRGDIRFLLREYAHRLGIVVLNVSHDRHDVLEMSDAIIYMKDGRIADAGEQRRLYFRPRTRDVARFLGHVNFFRASISFPNATLAQGGLLMSVPLREVSTHEASGLPNSTYEVFIPETWINFHNGSGDEPTLHATIEECQTIGDEVKLVLRFGDSTIRATVQDDDFRIQLTSIADRVSKGEPIPFTIYGVTPIIEQQGNLTMVPV